MQVSYASDISDILLSKIQSDKQYSPITPERNGPTLKSLALDYGIMTQESIDAFKGKIEEFKIDHKPDFVTLAASTSVLPFWLNFHEQNMHQLGNLLTNQHKPIQFGPKDYAKSLGRHAPVQLMYPLVNWKLRTLMQNAETRLHRHLYLFEEIAIGFCIGASTAFFTTPYQTLMIEALKQRKTTYTTPTLYNPFPQIIYQKPLKNVSIKTAYSNIIKGYGFWGLWEGTASKMLRNGVFASSLDLLRKVSYYSSLD